MCLSNGGSAVKIILIVMEIAAKHCRGSLLGNGGRETRCIQFKSKNPPEVFWHFPQTVGNF